MLILNKNILTIGGNRLEGGPLTPPTPPAPTDEITIGTQTWKKYNLAVDDGGTGIYHLDNVTLNGVNVGTVYYYTLDAARRVVSNISGWHIPTEAEGYLLGDLVEGGWETAGGKLKSTSGWNNNGNGTDDYGWGGYPVGQYGGSTTANGGKEVYYVLDSSNSNNKFGMAYNNNYLAQPVSISSPCPVRLIKDT